MGFRPASTFIYVRKNPRKFHPDFDPMIREILETDPRGIFVLVEAAPGFLTEQLRGRFAHTLGDVADRVRILPRMSKGEFLELIASADVVLDTPHYGGGANTTFETLALGKPLVTLAGQFHRGRFATGVLTRIGLDDFVTHSPENYARLAVALGGDAAWREQLSHKIARSAVGAVRRSGGGRGNGGLVFGGDRQIARGVVGGKRFTAEDAEDAEGAG